MCSQNRGNGTAAGTADTYPKPRIGKPSGSFLQKLPDGVCLVRIVPLIAGKQHIVGCGVQHHCFHCGRANIHAQPQKI